MQGLSQRVAVLECHSASTGGIAKDFRVIEMQLSRAEEKIMRLERASSWTRLRLGLQRTEERCP